MKLLKLDPGNGKTNFELAQLFFDANDFAQARERLRIALLAWLDADPEYAPAVDARKLHATLSSLP